MNDLKSEIRYADGEQFVAVWNDEGNGCDVYVDEVVDWQDGNGLIAHGDATEAEVIKIAAKTH